MYIILIKKITSLKELKNVRYNTASVCVSELTRIHQK